MSVFHYRAIDQTGRIIKGSAEATGEFDLADRLGQLGLELIACRRQRARAPLWLSGKITRRDLIFFCYHLEQTLRVGVPLVDSLGDLRESASHPRLRDITSSILAAVEGGKTLTKALCDHPAEFNDIFCSLIGAGEQSGDLAQVFCTIGENLKWQDEQAAVTRRLLAYPLFVGCVVIGVLVFLMSYLVPEMLQFVRMMGRDVPLHTRALIAVSGFVSAWWPLLLLIPMVLTAGVYASARSSAVVRHFADVIILALPLAGPLCKKLALARIARFMALMYASGITLVECIRAGEKISGNSVFAKALRRAGQSLLAGESLSQGLERTKLLPPMALRMIRVGESTGTLEKSLQGICYFYTRDAREAIDRLQSMIEPVMTLTLGGVIGWIMISILGPVYDLVAHIRI